MLWMIIEGEGSGGILEGYWMDTGSSSRYPPDVRVCFFFGPTFCAYCWPWLFEVAFACVGWFLGVWEFLYQHWELAAFGGDTQTLED